jgi:voltage-gated potassium channel
VYRDGGIWERRLEPLAIGAALLVIPAIVLEQNAPSHLWRTIATATNWIIWSVFALELVVLLTLAKSRQHWLRQHPLELAIVILSPPFLPASLQATRVLRLLRLVRLLRIAKLAKGMSAVDGVRYAAILALVAILGGGAAFAAAEGHSVSTWDGVWWAVATATTVGYGDIYPHTTWGRTIGIAEMLIGIGFFAILTAALAQRFTSAQVHEEAVATEAVLSAEVQAAEADLAAEIRDVMRRLALIEQRLASSTGPSRLEST